MPIPGKSTRPHHFLWRGKRQQEMWPLCAFTLELATRPVIYPRYTGWPISFSFNATFESSWTFNISKMRRKGRPSSQTERRFWSVASFPSIEPRSPFTTRVLTQIQSSPFADMKLAPQLHQMKPLLPFRLGLETAMTSTKDAKVSRLEYLKSSL